jgi:SAM-dependent methyltransferase
VRLWENSPARIAELRALLLGNGFTEENVCRRTDFDTIYDFKSLRQGRSHGSEIRDSLDILIRLFLDGEPLEPAVIAQHLSASGEQLLRETGLLVPHPTQTSMLAATAVLYPTGSLLIASDPVPGSPGAATSAELDRDDVVYAGVTSLTRGFRAFLPADPCERVLELCCGTAVAALEAAPRAGHVWATDIAERSVRFAEFNARLNGLENVTILQGDIYEPVAGMMFDRIVAHPPYVPSTGSDFIYAAAGEDGEDVLRGILAGLAAHLAPGGRLYLVSRATDRKEQSFQERLRDWLGESHAEFDVVVLTRDEYHPSEYYLRGAASNAISFQRAERNHHLYQRLGATRIMHCQILIERHASARPPVTARRPLGDAPARQVAEWLLRLEQSVADPDQIGRTLELRPALAPQARLRLVNVPGAGGWAADSCALVATAPFRGERELPPRLATFFLGRCDGQTSVREHLQRLKDEGVVSPAAPEAEFAQFVQTLVGEGFLQLPGLPAS